MSQVSPVVLTKPCPVVLVIEDEPGDAQLTKWKLLEDDALDFAVHLAESLTQADRLIKQGLQPDVVLLDLNLPDSSGSATVARCRTLCSAPVVVLTGQADNAAIQVAIESGAEDYLTKGFGDGIALRKAVRYAMLRYQRDADARLAAKVFVHSGEGILITDAQGTILNVNPAFTHITGYQRAEVLGKNPRLMSSGQQDRAFYLGMWQNLLEKGFWCGEILNRRKSGELYAQWLNVSAVRDAVGKTQQYVGLLADISERRRLEDEQHCIQQALQASEQRFRDIAGVSADWIWEVDAQARYTYVSDSVTAMLGYAPEEILGKTPFDFMSEAEAQRVANAFGTIVAERLPFRDMENTVLGKDGVARVTLTNGTPILGREGELLGFRGIDRNITERKRMEDQVRQLAFYDPLTRLANRRLLLDRLTQTMAASRRSGCYSALMFLDLDNFKPLNDSHGHGVGDLLLIEAADRLKACVREVDTVARVGGDEFVVIISELTPDRTESAAQAKVIAEKIRCAIAGAYLLGVNSAAGAGTTVEHHCTASVGVALFFNGDVSQELVLKSADAAMYQAKDAGRNRVCFHDASV